MRKPRLSRLFSESQDPDAIAHIYAVQCGIFIKVGITRHLEKRMNTIRFYNPHPLKLVMLRSVPAAYALTIEAEIHRLLGELHHRDEWFKADLEAVRVAAKKALAHGAGLIRDEKQKREQNERTSGNGVELKRHA